MELPGGRRRMRLAPFRHCFSQCLCAVVLLTLTWSAEPAPPLLDYTTFTQFGDPAGQAQNLMATAMVDDDGAVYLLFATEADMDDTGYEFAQIVSYVDTFGNDSHCYVRKLDSALNVVWTRSIRAPGEGEDFFESPVGRSACVPESISTDPADPSKLLLLFWWHQTTTLNSGIMNRGREYPCVQRVVKTTGSPEPHSRLWLSNLPYTNNGYTWQSALDANHFDTKFIHTFLLYGTVSTHLFVAADLRIMRLEQSGTLVWTWTSISLDNWNRNIRGGTLSGDESRLYALAFTGNSVLSFVLDTSGGSELYSSTLNMNVLTDPAETFPMELCPTCHNVHGNDVLYLAIPAVNSIGGSIFGMSASAITAPEGDGDVVVIKAEGNSTAITAEWVTVLGSSVEDVAGPNKRSLVAHQQHGVFLLGQTTGDITGFTNAGGLDFIIWWLNHDGTVKNRYQGGTNVDDMLIMVTFNPLSGRGPFVTGMTKGDIDDSGPQVHSGVNYDFVYGFMDFPTGCNAGTYRSGFPNCTSCDTGYYSSVADQMVCFSCSEGSETHLSVGATNCTLCNPGYYNPTERSSACTPCPSGTFTAASGSTLCNPCVAGTYADTTGASSCARCPQGWYSEHESSVNCTQCPLGSTTTGESSAALESCHCAAGYYGNPTGGHSGSVTRCKPCPENTECGSDQQYPHPVPGYWLTASDPEDVYKCSPSDACPGGSPDTCSEGYSGKSCVECSSAHYRDSGVCISCPTSNWTVIFVVVGGLLGLGCMGCVLCVAVVILAILGNTTRQKCFTRMSRVNRVRNRLQRTLAKYLIKYVQMLNVVMVLDVAWPVSVIALRGLITTLGQLFSLSSLIRVECLPNANESIATVRLGMQVTVLVLLILVTILTSLGGLGLAMVAPEATKRMRLGNVSSGGLQILSILYLTLHTFIVSPFSCYEQVAGEYRMSGDPSVRCFDFSDATWPLLATLSVIGFVGISLGVPLSFGLLLYLRRRRRSLVNKGAWFIVVSTQFMVEPYLSRYEYFELFAMLEKFLVPLGSMFVIISPLWQACYLLLVLLGFLLLYWKVNVFKMWEEYMWVITVSMATMMVVLVSMAKASADSSGESTSVSDQADDGLMSAVVYLGVVMIALVSIITIYNVCIGDFLKARRSRKASCQTDPGVMDGSLSEVGSRDSIDHAKMHPKQEEPPFLAPEEPVSAFGAKLPSTDTSVSPVRTSKAPGPPPPSRPPASTQTQRKPPPLAHPPSMMASHQNRKGR